MIQQKLMGKLIVSFGFESNLSIKNPSKEGLIQNVTLKKIKNSGLLLLQQFLGFHW